LLSLKDTRFVEINRFSFEHLLDKFFIIIYYNRRILFIKYYIVSITNIVKFTLFLFKYLEDCYCKACFLFTFYINCVLNISINTNNNIEDFERISLIISSFKNLQCELRILRQFAQNNNLNTLYIRIYIYNFNKFY